MVINDLTSPFQGLNDEWNDYEATLNDHEGIYNDLTLNTGNAVGDGDEWNTQS